MKFSRKKDLRLKKDRISRKIKSRKIKSRKIKSRKIKSRKLKSRKIKSRKIKSRKKRRMHQGGMSKEEKQIQRLLAKKTRLRNLIESTNENIASTRTEITKLVGIIASTRTEITENPDDEENKRRHAGYLHVNIFSRDDDENESIKLAKMQEKLIKLQNQNRLNKEQSKAIDAEIQEIMPTHSLLPPFSIPGVISDSSYISF